VRVFQHESFEDLGSIDPWLRARGAAIDYTRWFAGDPAPAAGDFDMLIAMGGPMSVNDEAELPWLRPEKQVVREAIAAGVPVLGVCLGSQLIASALGARVYPNAVKEIGWFPVRAVSTDPSRLRLPAECTVFHWHGETFDLPSGAIRLASSEACLNQAFQIGRHVVGLQFHLEMTPENVDDIVRHCGAELVIGSRIQTADQIRSAPPSLYAQTNALMAQVLDYLLAATPVAALSDT
jgi:GMP synthase-like glutamine amidotransferase